MDKKKTGELIRQARTGKKYTQTELGDLIGVTNKAVSRWENGESFPDIGDLERLSEIIDIKIQDIVVGEIQADHETALTEIVRLAKLQNMVTRKKILRYAVGIILLLYSAVIGCCGLKGGTMIGVASGAVYISSLGVVLLFMVFRSVVERECLLPIGNKVYKGMLLLSFASGIWIILVTGTIIVMTGRGITPFHMKAASVGPFIENQLVAVFLVNLAITIMDFYRMIVEDRDVGLSGFISIPVLYLAALYGDMLHRLSSMEEVYEMFFSRTMVVIIEAVISIIAVVVLKKAQSQK